jgi:uncharacterized protein (TIGR02271 family)
MPTIDDVRTWRGKDVVGPDGEKIGTLEDIYLDRHSGEPEWAAIKTGLFGMKTSFAPLQGATPSGEALRLNYDKSTVKDAPNVDADGELSEDEERRLYEHYGRSDYGDWDRTTDRTVERFGREEDVAATAGTTGRRGREYDDDAARSTGRDVSGPTTDDAMTRSEEELRVGTQRRETGRARLRKFVVTENVEQTVPVTREEVRLEREPITDANVDAATSGPEISEDEHEVTLHAEEPVVEKRTVPKERVRLERDTVTDEQTVSDEVRKERIDQEGDVRP